MSTIQRALISLTDKNGVRDFASRLHALDIEILSTGGTASKIRDAGIEVVDVADFTGFPEMLDGRVKTLHPAVHGGILYQRENPSHQQQVQQQGIRPVDLVAVNLYAFAETVARKECTLADAIENIDIGGPALLRAAAKNFHDVTVVVDPADYDHVLEEIEHSGNTTLMTRFQLMKKVYVLTAGYDHAIAEWLAKVDPVTEDYFQGAQ
ncbi:MAG: IMP cyclohydrolase [Desulfobulbus propionicus]|nr:MAG: IMP cyclohydrolase [Desulfobulbus propionicus]